MIVDIDLPRIIKILAQKNYCNKNGISKPNFKHYHEGQEKTNAKIRNILDQISRYFQLTKNYKKGMQFISYILKNSIAKLYAAKFKLKTRKKVFTKGGPYLEKPLKNTQNKFNGLARVDKP